MKPFRVAIVDDEPLARRIVRSLLDRDGQVEVVGEAGDGEAAVEMIRQRRPDIVFLDVEMPERGGLEVASAIATDRGPAIVFVTAFSSYAPEAFDVAALDYLVKPFADERFAGALERAKSRVRERRLSGMAQEVADLAAALSADGDEPSEDNGYLKRVPIHAKGRALVLKTRDIVWIEAQDYYARIHTATDSYLVRISLASFEERLDPKLFLRTHRSTLVNLDEVVAVEKLFKGVRELVLSTGDRCRVSRSRVADVEDRLLPSLR